MENSFCQLTKLKEITDPKTKKKSFTGEISIVYIRASWIQVAAPGIVKNRTISYLVLGDGDVYAIDIHPSDLIEAMKCNLLTTAQIMGAAKGELTPDKNFG